MSALQFDGLFIPMCGIQVFREYQKLVVRVRRCMDIFRLIQYVLDINQVLLDVLSRQNFKV